MWFWLLLVCWIVVCSFASADLLHLFACLYVVGSGFTLICSLLVYVCLLWCCCFAVGCVFDFVSAITCVYV